MLKFKKFIRCYWL